MQKVTLENARWNVTLENADWNATLVNVIKVGNICDNATLRNFTFSL
jgi:hypothetical protein